MLTTLKKFWKAISETFISSNGLKNSLADIEEQERQSIYPDAYDDLREIEIFVDGTKMTRKEMKERGIQFSYRGTPDVEVPNKTRYS